MLRRESESEQIILQCDFGDLIFVSKGSHEYQSCAEFHAVQFRLLTCPIWSPDVGDMPSGSKESETGKSGRDRSYGNQVCLTPKQRFRGGKGGARPKTLQGYKYNPLGTPKGHLIQIHLREVGASPTLAAMASLHGCAMVEFKSQAPRFIGVCSHMMVISIQSIL